MTIQEYDIVALTEAIPASQPETQTPLMLHRGQVGTVLMVFDDDAVLIDFSDPEGYTYAMETVPLQKLMPLFHEPVITAA
jgi:hypothetical protein